MNQNFVCGGGGSCADCRGSDDISVGEHCQEHVLAPPMDGIVFAPHGRHRPQHVSPSPIVQYSPLSNCACSETCGPEHMVAQPSKASSVCAPAIVDEFASSGEVEPSCWDEHQKLQGTCFDVFSEEGEQTDSTQATPCMFSSSTASLSKCTPCTFNECYRTLRILGSGSYGDVFQAQTRPFDLESTRPTDDSDASIDGVGEVAVKVFSLGGNDKNGAVVDEKTITKRRSTFETERTLLKRLNHPHIVKLHESFQTTTRLFLVLELCRGGELYDHVMTAARETGRGLPEKQVREFFRQMLIAVNYLHVLRIVHRDIKTENFLVFGERGSAMENVVKMCDFGTAVQLHEQEPRPMAKTGTPSYVAPEVYANRGAHFCSDMWSLGVVLYIMLIGANPFRTSKERGRTAIVKRIRRGDFNQVREGWLELSNLARAFIKSFLVVDERRRITCTKAISNLWMSDGVVPAPDLANFMPTLFDNIERFRYLNDSQQLAITAAARMIAEDRFVRGPQFLPWYEIFVALDLEHQGRLPIDRFIRDIDKHNSLHMSRARIEELVLVLDVDGSGYIEWTKWIIVAIIADTDLLKKLTPEPLCTIFRTVTGFADEGVRSPNDLLQLLNTKQNSSKFTSPPSDS